MFHTELERGDSLQIGSGLSVKLQRKHEDGSADFVLTCAPGASFTYAMGDESASVEVRHREGYRAKVAVDADRSVKITKQPS